MEVLKCQGVATLPKEESSEKLKLENQEIRLKNLHEQESGQNDAKKKLDSILNVYQQCFQIYQSQNATRPEIEAAMQNLEVSISEMKALKEDKSMT